MFRVIVVGWFDGVHLGHQHLLSLAKKIAEERKWSLLSYTFPPKPPALLPLSAKLRLLGELVDEVEVVPWEAVRNLSAEEFLRNEVVGRLSGRALVMGPDHRFGRGQEGNVKLAQTLGPELGLAVYIAPAFSLGGEIVSSQRIRALILTGQVEKAWEFLGRPPALFGQPIRGVGLATTLGFPTINLRLDPLLCVGDGVYLAWAFWEAGGSPGLFYHGKRPTFPELPPSAELHLFSPPRELPSVFEVRLLRFIRPDTRFPSKKALAERICVDVEEARKMLKKTAAPRPILVGV